MWGLSSAVFQMLFRKITSFDLNQTSVLSVPLPCGELLLIPRKLMLTEVK